MASDSDSSDNSSESSDKKAPAKKPAAKKAASSSDESDDSEASDKKSESEEFVQDAGSKKNEEEKEEGSLELFVQGVSFDTDEYTLRAHFEPYGTLTKCKLMRGKAFIEYETAAIAKKALAATNESTLDGR